MQKLFPILVSIAIIIAVALRRDRFRTVAALLVTLPINIPLSMWIVSNGAGDSVSVPAVYDFARATVIGLLVTLAWMLIVFLALRAGWALGTAIVAAYSAWAILVGVLFGLRVLSL